MEGADESTEQWRHPSSANCLYLVLIATGLPTVQHSPRVVDRVNKFDSVHVYFQPLFRSSVVLNINSSPPAQQPSSVPSQTPPRDPIRPMTTFSPNRPPVHVEPLPMPRMQAFATSSSPSGASPGRNTFAAATQKQVLAKSCKINCNL